MTRKTYAMNLGHHPNGAMLSTVSIINSLDEVTRGKVLAELPEELQRRYIAEQHAASFLAAARLNFNASSAQQMLASGFLNLSTPETVVGHTSNLLKAPVAGLAHAILKTSAATCVGHNIGIKTAGGASHNHGNTPMAHHIAARLPPGSVISNMDFNPTPVNGLSAHGFLGDHTPGLRISGASLSPPSMNARSVGSGLTSPSFGSNRAGSPGASTSHSFDPRVSIVHNTTVMTAARQLGAASTAANMQMGLSAGNSMHLTSPHRFSPVPGSFPPGINGHLVRHKTIISTYLEDFKQGFPTKGLSSVSNRWWGGAEPDKTTEMGSGVENSSGGGNATDASELEDTVLSGRCRPGVSVTAGKGKEANEFVKSCRRVTTARRRAVRSGKRALQLGVAKGYGVQKLRHKDAAVLEFVFGDSIPRQWLSALPGRD